MKKILALAIASFFVSVVFAQANWVTFKGDNRISVKFPSEPKSVSSGTYAASDNDSTAYIFTLVDFMQVAGIDSATLAPIKNTAEFTSQLKTGITQSLPDVQFDDFKISEWHGFTSYTTTGTDSKKNNYNMFMIIIGDKLYSFSTVIKNGISINGRDAFFSSVTLIN